MSSDDEHQNFRDCEIKEKANALMEQALELLDSSEELLVAAKLDDAICSLGVRKD
ncbi:hypothetical protein [Parasphingorhabdus sp.]|uniref:hypothetical protein n=1 Tax=Parasphingorhabdus sp. TaxID=2709688 RepID=UPI003289D640